MRCKKIMAMLLAGMMTIACFSSVYAESTQEQIENAQAEKRAAEADLENALGTISSLESKKQELESYLAELNAQYDELTGTVSELSVQAADKEEELKKIKKELKAAKKSAKKQYEDMKLRIVYMYENGGNSMLEILLSSEGLVDFINRAENIAQISQYDRDMLKKYEDLQQQIKEQEELAEEEAQAIDALLAESSAKKQEVQELAAGTTESIHSYISQISSSQAEADALHAQISRAENSISSLMIQAEAEAAAQREAEEAASREIAEEDAGENAYSENSDDDEVVYTEEHSEESGESEDSTESYEETSSASGSGTYLGNFTLTAYCNCAICCGTAGNLTASGTVPTPGRTVAMAGVPFGTKLLINGTVYTVEDLGTPYGHVDIFFNNHSDALAFGRQSAEVYQVG